MDDFEINDKELCSEEEWSAFFSTRCWQEFTDTIKLRLSDTRTRLEDCDVDMFQRFQGMAQEDRVILDMQRLIIGELKLTQKELDDERDE